MPRCWDCGKFFKKGCLKYHKKYCDLGAGTKTGRRDPISKYVPGYPKKLYR